MKLREESGEIKCDEKTQTFEKSMKFDGGSSKSNHSKFIKAVLIRTEKSTKLAEGLIYLGSSFSGNT